MARPNVIVAIATCFAVLSPAAGFAASRGTLDEHRSISRDDAFGGSQDGRRCIPLCNDDLSPCDPIQYKTADGRCDEPFGFR